MPFTGSSQMMLTTQARSGSFCTRTVPASATPASRRSTMRAAVDGFCEHLGLPQGEPLFDEGESYKNIYADYLMERYYPEDGGDR